MPMVIDWSKALSPKTMINWQLFISFTSFDEQTQFKQILCLIKK